MQTKALNDNHKVSISKNLHTPEALVCATEGLKFFEICLYHVSSTAYISNLYVTLSLNILSFGTTKHISSDCQMTEQMNSCHILPPPPLQ